MKHEIQRIEIRYLFTQDELNKLGPIIARLSQDEQEKIDEKKTAVADYNHQIAEIKRVFNENVNRLNNGFEYRWVDARKIKNYVTGEFEYYSTETYELVRTEPFKAKDYQREVDDVEDTPMPTEDVKAPIPDDNGTADSNPTRYANLLRELTYWRKQFDLLNVSTDSTDAQIEQGLEIGERIQKLELALKGMEPAKEETIEPTEPTANSGEAEKPSEEQKAEDSDPDKVV